MVAEEEGPWPSQSHGLIPSDGGGCDWEGGKSTVEPEEDLSEGESGDVAGVASAVEVDAEELEDMGILYGSGISEMPCDASSASWGLAERPFISWVRPRALPKVTPSAS